MSKQSADFQRGQRWFYSLPRHEKDQLGDAFVLGNFTWQDWLDRKPSSAFLSGADSARIGWEIDQWDR